MSDGSKIEWTDASLNPLRARKRKTGKVGWHCEHVSEGCRFCYAEPINRRLGAGLDYKPGHRGDLEFFLDEKTLQQPLHWRRPRKIFLGSMTDAFGEWVADEQLDRIFAIMGLACWHTFQVLTKRPERMRAYLSSNETLGRIVALSNSWLLNDGQIFIRYVPDGMDGIVLPNVWLGTSCEDQETADERIPHLLNTPAAVRFVSAEPLLGPIDLRSLVTTARIGLHPSQPRHDILLDGLTGFIRSPVNGNPEDPEIGGTFAALDWIIAGGESGPRARVVAPGWLRSIRDQCAAANVPFFFKQWGQFTPAEIPLIEFSIYQPNDYAVGHRCITPNGFLVSFPVDYGNGCTWVMRHVGKKAAGRLLDGIEHNAFPEVAR